MPEVNNLSIDLEMSVGDFVLRADFSTKDGLTALFGRSGSGKTTLINAIAGLSGRALGHIVMGDRVLQDSESNIFIPPQKRRIGYVFQEGRLFPHLSVQKNLEYAYRFRAKDMAAPDTQEIIELLNLMNLLKRRPSSLSGGEKQRVAIGRALLSAPELLVMDEPLAAIDAGHKDEIMTYIERLRDDIGVPIIYVSHDLEEVVRLADSMVILDNGFTVASGLVEEVMGRLDLRPLTGRYQAGAVLSVMVLGHDQAYSLTELGFPGGRVWVPKLDAKLGTILRMRVRARDISLSLSHPTDTSILNVLPATVTEIASSSGPQTEVLIDIGVPLIARVTRRSVETMGLYPGRSVFALIKAAAIDRHTLGLGGTRKRQN